MARKKKTTRNKPRFEWIRSIEMANVKRGLIALCWLIGLAGIAAVAWYGVPRLEAHAGSAEGPETIEILFVDSPAWVNDELQEYLMAAIEPRLTRDPFYRDELVQIRHELLNTGWFERVDQVRRVRRDRIEISGEYVDPFAVVRDHEGDHLVDPRGHLLPRTYPFNTAEQFIVITGHRFPRPGRIGMQWEGADINAALRLLGLIQAQSWRGQVAKIDITGVIRGGPIRLVTDRGTRIVWGSPPGEEAALEALTDRKLYYLSYLQRRYDRIDMGHVGEIDITSTTSIDHRE